MEAEGRNPLWGKILLLRAIGEGSDSATGNPHETGGDWGINGAQSVKGSLERFWASPCLLIRKWKLAEGNTLLLSDRTKTQTQLY